MATFNKGSRCFVTPAGKKMRGVHRLIHPKPVFKSAKQRSAAYGLGKKLDEDLHVAITTSTPPSTSRARDVLRVLSAHALVPTKTQVTPSP